MAEAVQLQPSGEVPNTGNPVFDATVAFSLRWSCDQETIRAVHGLFLELADKEPGGLRHFVPAHTINKKANMHVG